MIVIHGEGPTAGGDFTMCGLASDAFLTGDEPDPVNIAVPGESITCPQCRAVIAFYRGIRHNRQP